MTQRRTFTAEFKTQVVLDFISGAHSAAELCRQHQLNPQLLSRWKTEFLERASLVFEQDQQRGIEMELDIAKKASTLLSSPLARNGREWRCWQSSIHSR